MPSANYNYSKPVTSNRKGLLFVIGMAIVVIVIFTIIAVISFSPKSSEEEGEEVVEGNYILSDPGENTAMLQIYAAIDSENPTISDLEKAAHSVSGEATIRVDGLGIGYITLPDTAEQIVFDYYEEPGVDPATGESVFASVEDGVDPTEQTITPQPSDVVREVRYTLPLDDEGYCISYSSEENEYLVFDLTTTYEYSTKAEAIEAYLAPHVIEQ